MENLDYKLLVNSENPVPQSFLEQVKLCTVTNCEGDTFLVEEKAYRAFLQLRQALLEQGIQIELIAAHRTVERQKEIVTRFLGLYGEEYTKKYVAKPGCSEHHTGLALDVSIMVDGYLEHKGKKLFAYEERYQPIHAMLPQFGFVLRYPKPKEAVTGIGYEPWHFRYLDDPELAARLTEQGLCMEEMASCR